MDRVAMTMNTATLTAGFSPLVNVLANQNPYTNGTR